MLTSLECPSALPGFLLEQSPLFEQILEFSAAFHNHLCPRQVLGARMGLLAGALLGIQVPQQKKQLIAIVEMNGCFTDGVSAATNCRVGNRTMFVQDFGKIASVFADTCSGKTIRITPRADARQSAQSLAPDGRNRWEKYLLGYQRIPDEELFDIQDVLLSIPIEKLISRAGAKATCEQCGEEIFNEREVVIGDQVFCRSCAGQVYYTAINIPGN